ncbi:putative NAD+ kinase [Xylona heveae TC161]|uniref:Putative NAD+ kinase n=1 Tax=Xylona heveae (strain CBS 132557 / TC161) TaxID=1328760 RepID=A0A165JU35_XYLHT|nr:putative NAD+ kinase [Xylona heveae TC161]KZF26630.1 putative NAD+ kinase [Xylona heveae TC161]
MSGSYFPRQNDVVPDLNDLKLDFQDNVESEPSDDSDYQSKLEVEFDDESTRRRKSSLVPNEYPRTRPVMPRKNTSCIVHSLLEREGKSPDAEPSHDGIAESRTADKLAEDEEAMTRSRLLTKKELSDMAWGVRRLSKRLAGIKMKLQVRTIFILTKAHDETLIANTREVTDWLLSSERDTAYTVYVESTLEDNKLFDKAGLLKKYPSAETRLKFWTPELCARRPNLFDFLISLGGDGTVLYASWLFQRVVPPVLSFSLGSLGFLTKYDYDGYQETLTKGFRDGFTVSLRLRFEGTIMRSQKRDKEGVRRDIVEELVGEESDDHRTHKPEKTHEILNDVVVDRGPNPTMSTIELFGDDEHFTTVQADGICVATPTGSTAYNLAAGGSLCHPDNPVILVTAICAHTLSFRPIILPDTIVLRIAVPYDARTSSWASFDGRERVELFPGDYVTISASRYPFPSILPPGRRNEDWITGIQRTLQWNSRQRQKAFKEWVKSK